MASIGEREPFGEARTTVDSLGRVLTIRKLTVLDRLRLFKAAGPALAENHPWFGMAILASCATAIDEIPVPKPTTEAQIEAIVARLGEEGLAAIADELNSEEDGVHEESAGN
jgi:hypothetical protein